MYFKLIYIFKAKQERNLCVYNIKGYYNNWELKLYKFYKGYKTISKYSYNITLYRSIKLYNVIKGLKSLKLAIFAYKIY
jgi:hypothetical protein